VPGQAPRNVLAEKGLYDLANLLGAGILKLGEQELAVAFSPIQLPPELLEAAKRSTNIASLSRAAKAAGAVECVGFKMLSTYAVTLVYVLPTENGPWGVKLNLYSYKDKPHLPFKTCLFGISVASSWDGLEEMVKAVVPLEPKLEISRKGATWVEPGSSANVSQPFRPETNRTSSALDPRR